METKTQTPKPEVAVRTLSSDVASIEAGNLSPVAKLITPDLSRRAEYEEAQEQAASAPKSGKLKQIILIVILIAIAAVGYLYIYPMVRNSLAPATYS